METEKEVEIEKEGGVRREGRRKGWRNGKREGGRKKLHGDMVDRINEWIK